MPRPTSKSARKRETLALQALGERLVALPEATIRGLDTDEALKQAVLDAQEITAHGALRRQRQLIGKIMRRVDPEPLEAALEAATATDRAAAAIFRRAEEWRDRLVSEGRAALDEFTATVGENEELADCVSGLPQTVDPPRRKALKRRIFRLIHQKLAARDAV